MKGGLLAQAVAPPNLVTYVRIAVIPFVMYLMLDDSPRNAFIAAMFFCLVSATDFLDGFLARKLNMISSIGKFLDPLADKLLVLGMLLMLQYLGRISPWLVFIIMGREIVINTLRILAVGEGLVIAARELGKQKTALQMIGIWGLMVHYPYPMLDFIFDDPVDFHRVGLIFLWISVAFSLVSALDYFVSFFKVVAQRQAELQASQYESKTPSAEADAAETA